ncbi:MAG TPA: DUF2336 domain-containing protein [Caulobacteraceae bacterium]|nr:DUF2336 domain-containing protein [Caulobacteraceae bacterium]
MDRGTTATGALKAQDILILARSRQGSDRERLMLSVADLCEAGLEPGARLDPATESLVTALFGDLVSRAERDIRQALAERLAVASWAPHELICLLCADEIEIARPLIASSPVLTDADLVQVLRTMALDHQIEVARRPGLNDVVIREILERGEPAVLTALADNDTAQLSPDALSRLVDAAREVAALRSPLVRHPMMTAELAERLYGWVGESLRQAIVARFKVDAEALDKALGQALDAVQPGGGARTTGFVVAQEEERRRMERQLVAKLNDASQLKPGYLIRALREQRLTLFIAALAELACLDVGQLELSIEKDRPELLALACTAAGVDRSAFSTILALVRQLANGHPQGATHTGRRALQAFSIHDPQVAAAAFRKAATGPEATPN